MGEKDEGRQPEPVEVESEVEAEPNIERLLEVLEGTLLPEDIEFIRESAEGDKQDALGAAYASLLAEGIDPDEFFQEHDIFES